MFPVSFFIPSTFMSKLPHITLSPSADARWWGERVGGRGRRGGGARKFWLRELWTGRTVQQMCCVGKHFRRGRKVGEVRNVVGSKGGLQKAFD